MIANCSSETATVPAEVLPDLAGAHVLLATHPDRTSLELQPWESRIYVLG
jgi:oligo-1,6-glucosidase